MSWISARPLTALAALALTLRVACAIATEINPIFPPYYYTDAALTHAYAVSALRDVEAGRPAIINGTLGARVQTLISLAFYRILGPRPLAIKLLNAALGAAAVVLFTIALSRAFAFPAALGAGLVMAAWPTHVFYTSQNLKEAPIGLLAYAALGAAFTAGFEPRLSWPRASATAAAAGIALLGAGFYRSYVMICLVGALLGGLALAALRAPRRNALLTGAILTCALTLYPAASALLFSAFHSDALHPDDRGRAESNLIPVTYDNSRGGVVYRPTSPEGITLSRNARQWADRHWAATSMNREIGTQIYPDEKFDTWLDVLLYLPKGAFTVLFMPLPGLSAMDGKLGRFAAAAENVVLLALAALAGAGFLRGPKTPARLGLLAFFGGMTLGAALLEFDLGSAGRHKLLYLPMVFPFAVEEAGRLLGRRKAA